MIGVKELLQIKGTFQNYKVSIHWEDITVLNHHALHNNLNMYKSNQQNSKKKWPVISMAGDSPLHG